MLIVGIAEIIEDGGKWSLGLDPGYTQSAGNLALIAVARSTLIID